MLGLIVDAVDGVVQVAVDQIEPIPGAGGDDALGDEIVAIDDHLVMLIDPERALGRALPARAGAESPPADPTAPAGAESPEVDPAAPAGAESPEVDPAAPAEEPTRAARPSGPPPARRRSAATPQMPRSRRRPGHRKGSEE